MEQLRTRFNNREELKSYLLETFQSTLEEKQDEKISSFVGKRSAALERLKEFDVKKYARSRNFYAGEVTKLSPYIRHGLISQSEIREQVLRDFEPKEIEKFLQELTWRSFWQSVYKTHPEYIWNSVEGYKTGFSDENYADQMHQDILSAQTPNAAINHFLNDLYRDGYMHNHTRMYVASYVVHFRRVKWQVGAAWFLKHLIDGDPASNNLSWQWVTSTFSNRPYIFNLENVTKYCGSEVDCSPENNPELDFSYEALNQKLFPNLKRNNR